MLQNNQYILMTLVVDYRLVVCLDFTFRIRRRLQLFRQADTVRMM